MKSISVLTAELSFKVTKRALEVQNSNMWLERLAQCVELEDLTKLAQELFTKHQKCTYPRNYEQTAEKAASALIGHVLSMRITEQNRLEMLHIISKQRSNIKWLQRACFFYGL